MSFIPILMICASGRHQECLHGLVGVKLILLVYVFKGYWITVACDVRRRFSSVGQVRQLAAGFAGLFAGQTHCSDLVRIEAKGSGWPAAGTGYPEILR